MKKKGSFIYIFLIIFLQAPVWSTDADVELPSSLLTNPDIIPQVEETSSVQLQGGVSYDEDKVMTIALENDALDFVTLDDSYEIYTTFEDFIKVNKALEEASITDFIMNEVRYIPANYISLDEDKTNKILSLIEALEDLDDVQDVYHNLEIDE